MSMSWLVSMSAEPPDHQEKYGSHFCMQMPSKPHVLLVANSLLSLQAVALAELCPGLQLPSSLNWCESHDFWDTFQSI